MAAADDLGIGDDDLLHRRVLGRGDMIAFDSNLQRWTPLNAAIRFDLDGMSVYLDSVLSASGLGPTDVAAQRVGSIVFSVKASEPRSLDLGVLHTPAESLTDPVAFAHGVIVGDPAWPDAELRQRRNRLRTRFALTWGTVTIQSQQPEQPAGN